MIKLDDKEQVLSILEKHFINPDIISDRLLNDRQVGWALVKYSGTLYPLISEELQKDKEIVILAVSSYPKAIKYVPAPLRYDEDVLMNAVEGFLAVEKKRDKKKYDACLS